MRRKDASRWLGSGWIADSDTLELWEHAAQVQDPVHGMLRLLIILLFGGYKTLTQFAKAPSGREQGSPAETCRLQVSEDARRAAARRVEAANLSVLR